MTASILALEECMQHPILQRQNKVSPSISKTLHLCCSVFIPEHLHKCESSAESPFCLELLPPNQDIAPASVCAC